MRRGIVGALALALTSALVTLTPLTPLTPLPVPAAGADPAPEVIGCDRAADRVVLTASANLDPACTYTAGFEITGSGTTLDCRGATIAAPLSTPGTGILIHTPTSTALTDVTVRNCTVTGFVNSIRVTRDGFRTLADGAEFEHPTDRITIEGNHVGSSHGVGVYVDGYVSGVTIAGNTVHGAGSSGIYLETGSKHSTVTDNEITGNGFIENGPDGQTFNFGGTKLWFWGVGREGISVDGSYENTIRGNRFSGNSAGGIFLYKNCGEYPGRNPGRYFERRDPADRNTIEDNDFSGGRVGVWVGSRMGENTLPMECSDPAYVDAGGRRVVLDHAADNTIRGNRFHDVTYGIRVEDDGTTVAGNEFDADSPDHHAVIIGTPDRTEVLHRPVTGTVLTGNTADITGNDSPYRWVHGQANTTVSGNQALGVTRGICEGEPVPRQLFIFVIAVAPAEPDGSEPPTPDLTVPEIGALPSCWPSSAQPTAGGLGAVPAATPVTAAPAVPISGDASYTG